MSGTIVNNITRTSGTIAPTTGGLSWGSDVITGSTATVSAGNGYWINTTSNACTVTLPSSAEIGDQIILADYARTWSTNNLIIDSNGNNFQGETDAFIVDYSTAGQSLSIVYSDATKGWIPVSDDAVADAPVAPATQKGIFAFGSNSSTNTRNLVDSSGNVAADATGAGTAGARGGQTGLPSRGLGWSRRHGQVGWVRALFLSRAGRTGGADWENDAGEVMYRYNIILFYLA